MKQLLLAGLLLAYVAMFVHPNPDQEAVLKTEPIAIVNDVQLQTSTPDMGAYELGEDTSFQEISLQESLKIFEESGSAILFYAKAEGQESRMAAPVLDEAAKKLGVSVYYIDCGKPYEQADIDQLTQYISETFASSKTGAKTFYLPNVVAVKNGEITDWHTALVDGLILTGDEVSLPEDAHIKLLNAYIKTIQSAASK